MAQSLPAGATPPSPAASGLTVCPAHGVHYDARVHAHCVLCRSELDGAAKAAQRSAELKWVAAATVLMIGGAVAGGLHLSRKFDRRARFVTPAAMASGTESAHAACYSDCGRAHQECAARCVQADEQACDDHCLSDANGCVTECSGRLMKADPPWSYYYGTEAMPAWSAVLEHSLGLHGRLLACSGEPPVSALAHVRVRGTGGKPTSVALWKRGLADDVHACALGVLHDSRFPPSAEDDYEFLARFDARYDAELLLVAQAEAEIAALPRLVSDDSGDALKSRLLDARARLEGNGHTPASRVGADLRDAQARLAQLNRQLDVLRQRAAPQP